ncbi:MAG: tol-pal system-associated acyl-CoA thioesterase, partial [Yoonia sp.]|uniref:tol-pal system-associated acyl-CoA thioesterase n=1 Tax=Yoonia sp. TaxID=2212373 RepID=UPI003EF708A3
MTHRFPVRVYYEDTDFGGIVYYANYLKFIERGRSEWVREMGIDQLAMKRDDGVVFAVRRVEADYHAPAVYDDELIVTTTVDTMTGARLIVRQTVERGDDVLFSALVTLVAINDAGGVARLPAA